MPIDGLSEVVWAVRQDAARSGDDGDIRSPPVQAADLRESRTLMAETRSENRSRHLIRAAAERADVDAERSEVDCGPENDADRPDASAR